MSDELRTTENAGVLPGGELGMAARTLVEERIRGLGKAIGRNLAPVDLVVTQAPPQVRQHLFEEEWIVRIAERDRRTRAV